MKSLKFALLITMTAMLGLSSCSSNDATESTDEAPMSVRVSIATLSTYSEESSAVGMTPTLKELHVFFTDGITIKETGVFSSAEILAGTKEFTGIPGSATTVIMIGNALSQPTLPAITTIAKNEPIYRLNNLMFQQSQQTDPINSVNLHGTGTITNATAIVNLTPAVARIEIAKVEAKNSGAILLLSFELAGIYINNTYTACGTNYRTLPSGTADILNYGSDDLVWTDNTYPDRFKDEIANPNAGLEFEPITSGNKWSYYVMPVAAGLGTTIDGEVQTSVPHIILKITNPKATGYEFPETMYVTVKDIQVGGISLTHLTKGKVYSIASLAFSGENLVVDPEIPGSYDVSVTAIVTEWENEIVNPIIP